MSSKKKPAKSKAHANKISKLVVEIYTMIRQVHKGSLLETAKISEIDTSLARATKLSKELEMALEFDDFGNQYEKVADELSDTIKIMESKKSELNRQRNPKRNRLVRSPPSPILKPKTTSTPLRQKSPDQSELSNTVSSQRSQQTLPVQQILPTDHLGQLAHLISLAQMVGLTPTTPFQRQQMSLKSEAQAGATNFIADAAPKSTIFGFQPKREPEAQTSPRQFLQKKPAEPKAATLRPTHQQEQSARKAVENVILSLYDKNDENYNPVRRIIVKDVLAALEEYQVDMPDNKFILEVFNTTSRK